MEPAAVLGSGFIQPVSNMAPGQSLSPVGGLSPLYSPSVQSLTSAVPLHNPCLCRGLQDRQLSPSPQLCRSECSSCCESISGRRCCWPPPPSLELLSALSLWASGCTSGSSGVQWTRFPLFGLPHDDVYSSVQIVTLRLFSQLLTAWPSGFQHILF